MKEYYEYVLFISLYSRQLRCLCNNPSDCIIQSKESWWRKFGWGSNEETQPASPQKEMSQGWQSYTMLGLAGWKSLSNTLHDATGHRRIQAVQPLPNSYKQWMNAKSNNPCEPCYMRSTRTISSTSSLHRSLWLDKEGKWFLSTPLCPCSLWLCNKAHWSPFGS